MGCDICNTNVMIRYLEKHQEQKTISAHILRSWSKKIWGIFTPENDFQDSTNTFSDNCLGRYYFIFFCRFPSKMYFLLLLYFPRGSQSG